MTEWISVTDKLPNNGQKCLCFGHKTYCCKEDMEDKPTWHEVIFKFHISSYMLKSNIPKDPEETILSGINIYEIWECADNEIDEPGHIIGVTEWKPLPKLPEKT